MYFVFELKLDLVEIFGFLLESFIYSEMYFGFSLVMNLLLVTLYIPVHFPSSQHSRGYGQTQENQNMHHGIKR